ncbi:MAG: acyl carrier protein [Nitrosomonas sp.]|nr:acyl carrier protein [Nitrosomonas sp.]MCW5607540.1 acyl carrier protein [Nitrosomonas sp.]
MSLMDDVKRILRDTLALDIERVEKLTATSPLLGNIIELDSVGVVSVLTAIEEEYGIVVEDDEISADILKTLGSLTEFIEHKIEQN